MISIQEWCIVSARIRDQKGFITTKENILEKLMLVVTEVAEAAEAVRHADWDNFSEELADVCIRIFDICGTLDIDLEDAIAKKTEINRDRPYMHGKKA